MKPTPEQVQKMKMLLANISMFYPGSVYYNMTPDMIGNTAKGWARHLGNESEEMLMNALDIHVGKSQFPPKINELKDIITDLKCPEFQETADEAWEALQAAIRACGWYQEQIALRRLSELGRMATLTIGYESLCNADAKSTGFLRQQFIKAYNSIAKRERDECKEIGDNKFVLEQIHKNEKLLAESTKLIGTNKPVKKIEREFRESDADEYKLAKCREIRAMIMRGKDDDED